MKFYKQNRENRVQSALKTAENALPRLWRVLERSVITVPCQRPTNRRKTAELFDFECRPRGTFPSQSSGPQLQGWVVSFQYWSQRPDRSSDPDTWKANTSMSHRTLCKNSKNTKVGKLQKCQKTLSVYGACGASKKKRYKWMACILPLAHKSRVPNFFIQGAAQLRRFLLSLPGRDSPKLRSEASFYKLQDLGIELLGSWDTLNSLMMTFNHS